MLFGQNPELDSHVGEFLEIVIEENNLPGVGYGLVLGKDSSLVGGEGRANLSEDIPIGPNTKFRVGSVSKSFIAAALLLLEQRGVLSLYDPISKWIPDIPVDNPYDEKVRIVHLLEHTAGMDDMHYNEMYEEEGQRGDLSENLLVNERSKHVRWSPGSMFSYSNPGYGLAGYIIEKASGIPFEQFIQEELFDRDPKPGFHAMADGSGLAAEFLSAAKRRIRVLQQGFARLG